MDTQDKTLLRSLFTEQRVAALAVVIDGAPYASLVPFSATEDFGAVLIHVSKLARHSAGLEEGSTFSALIHQPDCDPGTQPAQLARVSIEGTVRTLARDTPAYADARERYLAKFPKSAMTFQLGDFSLLALQIETGRYVAGFAKTFDLDQAAIRRLA